MLAPADDYFVMKPPKEIRKSKKKISKRGEPEEEPSNDERQQELIRAKVPGYVGKPKELKQILYERGLFRIGMKLSELEDVMATFLHRPYHKYHGLLNVLNLQD